MPVIGRLQDEANTSEIVSTAEHLAKKKRARLYTRLYKTL